MKLLIPLLLLAIGAIIWALSAPTTVEVKPAAQPEAAAQAEAPSEIAAPPREAPVPPVARAQPERVAPPKPKLKPRRRPDAPPVAAPGPISTLNRAPGTLSLDIVEFKEGVRRYYANRPSAGIPARVEVDEILPRALIERLGVAYDAELLELGHHSVRDARAYESLLAQDERYMTTVGVTIRTQDGRTVRDYITLEAAP